VPGTSKIKARKSRIDKGEKVKAEKGWIKAERRVE